MTAIERWRLVLIAVAFEGGLALSAWGTGALLGVPAFGALDFTWSGALWGAVASVPMLGILFLVMRSDWLHLARFRKVIHAIAAQIFSDCNLADLALISALAGIGEEALFRGVMQPFVAGAVGPWIALAATSLAFGLAHYVSRTYALFTALIGLWLGALLIASGNLLVPIMAHAMYDFVALVYLVRFRRPLFGPKPAFLRTPLPSDFEKR